MQVPFFDYPRHYTDNRDSLIGIFDEVCSRGAFIMQADVERFERNLADYCNAGFAIGVGNATDGLELSWMAMDIPAGGEVIVSAHTMLATASAVKIAGGVPVPVDIGEDGLIDPDRIEAAIGPKTVGIMPTQLNGRVCQMDRINQIAKKHGLVIVEDAAQSLGAKFDGQSAGTFGAASAISFFPAKTLGSLGDAGAVLTNSDRVADIVFQLHDHGRNKAGVVKRWGRNSRLDNLQAAFLADGLRSYDDKIKRRRQVASLYQDLLGDVSELHLPPPPDSDPRRFDVFQNYELTAERRDDLVAFLKSKGVGTLIQWGGFALSDFPMLDVSQPLPRTKEFFQRCVMLPMNTFVSDDQVLYVANTIKEFYSK